MPKINVRPLDNMNNSIPYKTPLKSEKIRISKEPGSPLPLFVMYSGAELTTCRMPVRQAVALLSGY